MKFISKRFQNLKSLGWPEGKKTCFNPKTINLQWAENPVPPIEAMKDLINEEFSSLNLYPEPIGFDAITIIANCKNLSEDNVVVDRGIDGILNLLSRTIFDEGDEIITISPSFPIFETVAALAGAKTITVSLEEDFSLDINKLISVITPKTKAIFIANPNNPTGNILLNNADINFLAYSFDGLLVLDECYACESSSAIDLTKSYSNLLVLRSYSKMLNLAGLRIGYAVGNKELISAMKSVQANCNPFVLDRIAQVASSAIFYEDEIYCSMIKLKNSFEKLLSLINNVDIIPTKTTFIILDLIKSGMSETKVRERLSKEDILIKDSRVYGFNKRFIRLGIPRIKDQDRVFNVLKSILES